MRGTNYRPISQRARKTFGQAALKWIEEWQGKDRERQAIAIKHLLPYIGTKPLYKINNAALDKYKEDRLKVVSASTVRKEIALVTNIMRTAASIWEWIDYVPTLILPDGPQKVAQPLTWEMQDRFFARLPQWWAEGPCLFMANTGMRPNEAFGLEWEYRDPEEGPEFTGYIVPFKDRYVVVTSGKNGKDRAVPCNSLATLAIDRQKGNGSRYVFPSRSSRNKGGRITNWNRMVRTAWDAAGLPSGKYDKRGIHNLRHTYGYRLRRAGVTLEDRRLLLGHGNASITEDYSEGDLDRLMQLAEKVTVRPEGQEFMLRSIKKVG